MTDPPRPRSWDTLTHPHERAGFLSRKLGSGCGGGDLTLYVSLLPFR